MAAAALYIGAMLLMIVYLTVFRSAGWAYSPYAFLLIEYGFIYTLFLGSPWLIRHRSHVYIEMLTAALAPNWRTRLSRLIVGVCGAVCIIWAWYSGHMAYWDYVNLTYDEVRSQLDVPRWITTVAFSIGFLLMGIEFLRYVFTPSAMHGGVAGIASERAELEEQRAAMSTESR